MKAKVIKGPWKDYKEKKLRQVGDEFICTKARFDEINKKLQKFEKGNWIEEVKQESKKEVKEETKTKK